MSTTLAPPDPHAVDAWRVYAESLRGLTGAGYEQAEEHAWAVLQAALMASAGDGAAPRAVLG